MRIGLVGTGRIGTFHATTLQALDGVDTVLVADADAGRARALAAATGLEAVPDVDALYTEGVDALVVTAATGAHAALVHQALDREVPVFCEKPVALDVPGTREVVDHAERSGVPVQVGFQRRFDLGYRAARQALLDGDLGWLHTVRAVTGDEGPPPAAYIATSGGLFRDCSIHDFDVLRWVTGREVVSVSAFGANRGAPFFGEAGDVDTCAALLRFDDDLLGTVTATRYNGAGHDVRLELCGSKDARFVGLDDRAPMPTAERSVSWRRGRPYASFMERFHDAYAAELACFVEVASGRAANPCPPAEALEALYIAEACELSRHRGRPVDLAEVRAQQAGP